MFSFSIMKSSFCFTAIEIIAIPATGFVNYLRFLRTIQAVLVWKERFDVAIILKNYVIYKASCWDCNDFYIGKTKRRLHDRKN